METPLITQKNNEEVLLTNEFTDMFIKYRYYVPEDGPSLISLEDEASQFPTLFGLLRGGSIYREPFDCKSKRFKDYIILVAEAVPKGENQRSNLAGGVCLGIKEIYFNGQLRKSGVLYDLRVSENYQRKGIGTTLCTMLERIAATKGCDFFYLSVNSSNKKAMALYTKMGYETISERKVLPYLIPPQKNEVAPTQKEVELNGQIFHLSFRQISREQTLTFYNEFYTGKDLALKDWNEMIDSPGYIGTYIVSSDDDKNLAGISLQRNKKSIFMGIKRLIIDTTLFNQIWITALFMAIILALLVQPFEALRAWPETWGIGGFGAWLIGFIMIGTLFWVLIYGILRLFDIIKMMGGFSIRGRIIGPFKKVQEDRLTPHLLNFLSEGIGRTAANEDFAGCLYNCDFADTFANNFPGMGTFGPSTKFMGKFIKEGTSLKDYKMTSPSYFDPRDL